MRNTFLLLFICGWLAAVAQPVPGNLKIRQESYDLLREVLPTNVLIDRAYGEISPSRGFSDRKTTFSEWIKIFSILSFGAKEEELFTFNWQLHNGIVQTLPHLADTIGDHSLVDTPADLLLYLDHLGMSPNVRIAAVNALAQAFGIANRDRLPEFQLVPVGVIFEPYALLRNKAKRYLDFRNDSLVWLQGEAPQLPFSQLADTNHFFTVQPLVKELIADTVVYYFDQNLLFSTTAPDSLFRSLRVDFGDGKGPQTVTPGGYYTAVYPKSADRAHLRAQWRSRRTHAVLPAFRSNILPLTKIKPAKNQAVATGCEAAAPAYRHSQNKTRALIRRMSAAIQFDTTGIVANANGTPTTCHAEMRVICAHTDNKIRQPFIIVTGYNPFPKPFSAFVKDYNSLESPTTSGLLTRLIEDGYDVCIFKPVSGVDYIENNARLMEQALRYLQQQKVQNLPANCLDSCRFQNVVIGWSAGGLTAKLCLASMEHAHLPHHTRLYLSWDGEHKGANIPLGVQHSLGYLADYTGPVLRKLVSALNDHRLLNSPCAEELLALHYTRTGTPAHPAIGCAPARTTFLQTLNSVGNFPRIRKAALAAGGSKGEPFTAPYYTNFTNGETLFSGQSKRKKAQGTRIIYHAAPAAAVFTASRNGDTLVQAVADTTQYPAWDNCPGSAFGKTGFMGIIGTATGIYLRFLPGCASIHKAGNPDCFVPVISALDINTTDPYYNPAVKTPGSTPFDATISGTCQDQHNNGKMVEKAATFILEQVKASETCPSPSK